MRRYTVLVHEADEGGYWAEVEELPGCFASGDTLDELEADMKDAIATYLAAVDDGDNFEMGFPRPRPGEG